MTTSWTLIYLELFRSESSSSSRSRSTKTDILVFLSSFGLGFMGLSIFERSAWFKSLFGTSGFLASAISITTFAYALLTLFCWTALEDWAWGLSRNLREFLPFPSSAGAFLDILLFLAKYFLSYLALYSISLQQKGGGSSNCMSCLNPTYLWFPSTGFLTGAAGLFCSS